METDFMISVRNRMGGGRLNRPRRKSMLAVSRNMKGGNISEAYQNASTYKYGMVVKYNDLQWARLGTA